MLSALPPLATGERTFRIGSVKTGREQAQQGSPYSITSSARCRRNMGTSRPRAVAVLRLITSSNLTGACTGSSLGLAPLKMRSA